MTASKPADWSARRSARASSTMPSTPRASSWSGVPGRAPRCTIAITGLTVPKTSSYRDIDPPSSVEASLPGRDLGDDRAAAGLVGEGGLRARALDRVGRDRAAEACRRDLVPAGREPVGEG